jgi:tetratricopeptide (TPR) repeat protein
MDTLERAKQLFLTGLAANERGDFAAAEASLRQALALAPDRTSVLNHLALTLTRLNRHGDAETMARRAVELDGRNVDAWMVLGICSQQLGQFEDALTYYDKALALDPGNFQGWCNRAACLNRLRRFEDALTAADRALVLNKVQPEAHFFRGLALRKLQRQDEALQAFDRAIEEKPGYAQAWYMKAAALQELKRNEAALGAVNASLKLDGSSASSWYRRGSILQALARHDEALLCYEKVIELRPTLADAWADRAGVYISALRDDAAAIAASEKSLRVFLSTEFHGPAASARGRLTKSGIAFFRLKHDLGQARYLSARGYAVSGLDAFADTAMRLLDRAKGSEEDHIAVSALDIERMLPYLAAPLIHPVPQAVHGCLNTENDWSAIERQYLESRPEIVVIDDFLAPEALGAFREYSLISKIWLAEYSNKYLGAFANRGFISELHLQLARELRQAMPKIFRDFRLTQLWGFKYDTTLGKGINVHADFADVNLNFWITPDQYNLDPTSGGLKLFDVPSPPDWHFLDFNSNKNKIYDFLKEHGAQSKVVPHRCNRAVLFNSALFHETDKIAFEDGYETRRVNFTYLFGRQL